MQPLGGRELRLDVFEIDLCPLVPSVIFDPEQGFSAEAICLSDVGIQTAVPKNRNVETYTLDPESRGELLTVRVPFKFT